VVVSVQVMGAYSSHPSGGYRVLAFTPSATSRQARILTG
jgi:hypothetical protein